MYSEKAISSPSVTSPDRVAGAVPDDERRRDRADGFDDGEQRDVVTDGVKRCVAVALVGIVAGLKVVLGGEELTVLSPLSVSKAWRSRRKNVAPMSRRCWRVAPKDAHDDEQGGTTARRRAPA